MPKPKPDDFTERMLAETRADVSHADQKASLLLAALGIGFATLLGGQLSGDWDSSRLALSGQVVWWAGIAAAATSVAASALAVWPRYKTDDGRDGITYWGHVAAYENLHELVDALAAQRLGKGRDAHQLWRLSRLVHTKYRWVRASMVLAAFAVVLLTLAALVIR